MYGEKYWMEHTGTAEYAELCAVRPKQRPRQEEHARFHDNSGEKKKIIKMIAYGLFTVWSTPFMSAYLYRVCHPYGAAWEG